MNRKKWLYLIIIIILVVPVLFIHSSFNGNPIAKFNSKSTLKKHLAETYSEDSFIIGDPFYDFKFGGYNFEVERIEEHTNKKFEFIVTGFFGTHVHYDEIYYDNLDDYIIAKFERQANEEIADLLKEHVSDVLYVGTTIEVLKGRYEKDTNWHKNIELEQPIGLWIETEAKSKSAEDVFQTANKIQEILEQEQYDYERVTINARVSFEGDRVMKYGVGFTKGEKIKLKDVERENKHLELE